ncbi:hypothetical protein HPB50_015950 [Hyalomma asiaticum]|uniref:Uncharacterized protein n=1 Tax=Hyalomma asiaticum TaxID=266040 RepID=A0ACB7SM97_HYAAI|nr:hypothetical protein HPB50_015950 [Hyalomma asiaticum]
MSDSAVSKEREKARRASTASKQSSKAARKKSVSSVRASETARDEQSRGSTAADIETTSRSSSKKDRRKSCPVASERRRRRSKGTVSESGLESSNIKTKEPAAPASSQPTPAVGVGVRDGSASMALICPSTKNTAEAATASCRSTQEKQQCDTGPAVRQAAIDKLTRPSEDTEVEPEVPRAQGVPRDVSASKTPDSLPPKVTASGTTGAAKAADGSAAASHASATAVAVAAVLSSPPPKELCVTSPQDAVAGAEAVASPPAPPSTRALTLRERLKTGAVLSPISLRLASLDLAAMVKSPKFSGSLHYFTARHAIAAIVVGATLFLVVTCFLLIQAANHPRRKEVLCLTDDCVQHANLLMRAAEPNIDACDDFRAHVCSKWSPHHQGKQLKDFDGSAMKDMVFSWHSAMKETLEKGSQVFDVGKKPLAMLESCMSNVSSYGSTIVQMQEFMRDYFQLSWPKPPRRDIKAIGVLIKLAYALQAPFWFAVRPSKSHRGGTEGRWSMILTPAPLIRQYFLQYRTVRGSGLPAYVKYWRDFYSAFSSDTTEASEERAIQAEGLEGRILKVLSDAVETLPKHVVVLPLGQLDTYTPTVNSSDWLSYLQLYTKLKPALSERDVALITDRALFVTVGELLKNYTNEQILDFLGWQFVQRYAPVADSRFLISVYGDNETAMALRPAFCGYHVEVSYKVLLLSLRFVAETNSVRKVVDEGYNRLLSMASRLLNESTWLDSESKAVVAEKLASVKLRLWPPAAFLDNANLERTFKNFPINQQAFGDYWIRSIDGMTKLKKTQEYEEVLDMPLNSALPYFEYDYIENAVGVAIGAISFPLVYKKGTKAMFYGGFGFSAAFQLAKALDQEGIHWHPDGFHVESILTQSSKEAFERRQRCLSESTDGKQSLFPEIPALEIAYAAFRDDVGDPRRAIRISDQLNELKVFFMTICYMTCTRSGTYNPFSADCNKLARHSSAFAKAFRCRVGSKMNPKRKCTFFA